MGILRKSLALVHIGAKLTFNQRRLINRLIELAQAEPDLDRRVYLTSLVDLKGAYRSFQNLGDIVDDLMNIQGTPIKYNLFSSDVFERKLFSEQLAFLSHVRVGDIDAPSTFSSATSVRFEFPSEVRDLVLDPKVWANISVEHFKSVTQLRSQMLLELVACYHRADDIDTLRTFSTPWFDIGVIQEYYGVTKMTPGVFMGNYIRHACKDLAQTTPYKIEAETEKVGAAIKRIRFNVLYRALEEKPADLEPSAVQLLERLTAELITLGFPQQSVASFVGRTKLPVADPKYVTAERMAYCVAYYQWLRRPDNKGSKPTDYRWLITAIRDNYTDPKFDAVYEEQRKQEAREAVNAELKPVEDMVRAAVLSADFGDAVVFRRRWLRRQNRSVEDDAPLNHLTAHLSWIENTPEGRDFYRELLKAKSELSAAQQYAIAKDLVASYIKRFFYSPDDPGLTVPAMLRKMQFVIEEYHPALVKSLGKLAA